ncbi:MAG TPA: metal-dependent transcriptional regulator [Solirubrobacterales bacterium]|nr:metal-dependent transcriptional regulator [Solirubrobacterales bacterium]
MGQRIQPARSAALEDYAKTIYALQMREGGPVSTSALAERLDVSPGTVTSMLRRLADEELATYEPYHGVGLTPAGERLALEVIRHHRLLEAYLAEALGMPWDQVHAEADVLEHYISEELEALISDALGNPEVDPHGDPIPTADLKMAEDTSLPLTQLQPGQEALFVRISDSDGGMLRYLGERGIAPGDRLQLIGREPYGGPFVVSIDGETHSLGSELAAAIRVSPGSRG